MTRRYFEEDTHASKVQPEKREDNESAGALTGLFNNVRSDDLILLGLILFLLQGECRDKELILVLGFLFISG